MVTLLYIARQMKCCRPVIQINKPFFMPYAEFYVCPCNAGGYLLFQHTFHEFSRSFPQMEIGRILMSEELCRSESPFFDIFRKILRLQRVLVILGSKSPAECTKRQFTACGKPPQHDVAEFPIAS